MQIHWLEQTEADVPAGEEWLSANEALRSHGIFFAKRRNDWRLGRWTAKTAWAAYLNLPCDPRVFREIEIRPAASGAPVLFYRNNPAGATISLSHRDGTALCAIAPSGGALGCDLEIVEPHSEAFLADYFTAQEQALVAHAPAAHRSLLLALLWSAKESALKALHEGLRLDTRCMIAEPLESLAGLDGWRPLQVRHTEGQIYRGWWQQAGKFVRTVVAAPAPGLPIRLPQEYSCSEERQILNTSV